jgi:hypothetical protein
MGEGNEVKKLVISAVLVVAISVITLMGISITREYSETLRSPAGVNLSTTTTTLLINASVRVGTSGQYPFLQTATGCVNASNEGATTITSAEYTVQTGDEDGGFLRLDQAGIVWNNTGVNCSTVTYLADSDAQAAADLFTVGLGIFGSFIAVLVLALMGKTIIGLFKKD